jgi:hypothetical protein
MYVTHTFAHRETLSRAHAWLTRLGFHAGELRGLDSGVPRLKIRVEPDRHAAVQMLINAAENADPDGFPSFWDHLGAQPATSPRPDPAVEAGSYAKPGSWVLGWHPLD